MPPKLKKKGRPRGAETTVIGLLPAKNQNSVISKSKPFSKLSLLEKDMVILECFTNKVKVVVAAMVEDFCQLMICLVLMRCQIYTVRDENTDIHRMEIF